MIDQINIPIALILGCNTPHGVGVLSDWIEEQTGCAPDFYQSGWSEDNENVYSVSCCYQFGDGNGTSYGYFCGHGYGL